MSIEEKKYFLGIDVGSTTVKAVLYDFSLDKKLLWKRYERHETKQADKVLYFLQELEKSFPKIVFPKSNDLKVGITGSGGQTIAQSIGAEYHQEVLCVCKAVEMHYPTAGSVIELGGQDAKIILFKDTKVEGRKRKIMSMNDKCAGGTGAVIDKIARKLNINHEELLELKYKGIQLHPVAGKCGVFAETDINSLQKQGIPSSELMASLYEAIVQQNLAVLTRGSTLNPDVLLLGGPNAFLPGLQEAWEENILQIWEERNVLIDPDIRVNKSNDNINNGVQPNRGNILVPENGQYFGAIGVVYVAKAEKHASENIKYNGSAHFSNFLKKRSAGIVSNLSSPFFTGDLAEFKQQYIPPEWIPQVFPAEQHVRAILGIDGGSTSTKGVLVNEEGEVIASQYMLSEGNPISDTINIIQNLREDIEKNGAKLEIISFGVTGYAKDILKDIFGADVAVVETVAHTIAAQHYYDDVDVIVDIGGQDIKIIHLLNGAVKDFKLNTQCSAGNGYFLQNTAEGFGYDVSEYADLAFSAKRYPNFSYGCAVFLQTDIVDFQRQGWESQEILAGLVDVLPKNIWQYVAKIPNPGNLGNNFVLQGGTQKNLAAVWSQIKYLHEKCEKQGKKPNINVHKFTSVCGAVGAALEAKEENLGNTDFIGLDESENIEYTTIHNESTTCYYCKNKCVRTFIEFSSQHSDQTPNRLIIAPCDKGRNEQVSEVRNLSRKKIAAQKVNPDLVQAAAEKVWQDQESSVSKVYKSYQLNEHKKFNRIFERKIREERKEKRVGMPRVLNHYNLQPFYTAYFQCLGFSYSNIVFSDFSSEELFKEGSKRGTVDPCFPSKVSISHMHDLLQKHKKEPLDFIFMPMVSKFASDLKNQVGHHACPTAVGSPEMVASAFTKERDVFTEENIELLKPFLYMHDPGVTQKQLFEQLSNFLQLDQFENEMAVKAGFAALKNHKKVMERDTLEVLQRIEDEKRLAIVMLGRAYHNDPGINHLIMEQFQEMGYPIINVAGLPTDMNTLQKYFNLPGDEKIHPLDISDVWKNSFSTSSSQKIWAAKFIARHPNLIPVELSSFKCGHDSTLYSVIEKIIESSNTPLFSFRDIDENNPKGSIKIRVETIDYFLNKYQQEKNGKKIVSSASVMTLV